MKLQCWTLAALLALGCASAHAATAEPLAFKPGNPKAKAALAHVPELRDLVEEQFSVAFVDLDGDGQMEIVVNAESSAYCGSGGCATVVLQQQGNRMVVLLDQNLFPVIGVTREKFGGYRALAALGERDRILVGEKAGTPMYRKRLIYPMQTQAGTVPAAATPAPKAARGSATLEMIVNTLAHPLQASGPAPGWPALDRLGVKWQYAGLKQTQAGYIRQGTLQLDGLGKTSVTFQGSRSEPHRVSLSPPNKPQEESDGFGILKRLLPAAQVKQVRAACKHEGAVFSTAVYQVAVTGHRPAYVMLTVETNKQNFASTSMDIAAQFSKDWNCPP